MERTRQVDIMKQNVSPTDKSIRLVLAAVLFSLIFVLQGNLRWIGLIGIVPLLTGMIGTCPIYMLLGISTCPIKKKG